MMIILDWVYTIFYYFTLSRGSRYERANFLLWFSSSFIYVAVFYLILRLVELQIYKSMYLPLFFTIFGSNYLILWYIYIKRKRSEFVIKSKGDVSKWKIILYRLLAIFFTFLSMVLMVLSVIYYGKFVSFV